MVPIGIKEVWKSLNVRLSIDLRKRIRKRAKELNIPMAELVRQIIIKELGGKQ